MRKGGVIFLFVLLVALFIGEFRMSEKRIPGIHFFDVGQGDSALIITPFGQNILIDGGPDRSVLTEIGRTLGFFDRTIDLMILTHPHDDHVSGLIGVLESYKVGKVMINTAQGDSPSYRYWLEVIGENNIQLITIEDDYAVELGEGHRLVIRNPRHYSSEIKASDLNNSSLIIEYYFDRNSALITGDIEAEAEDGLMPMLGRFDILKVAHHGADTSSGEAWLDIIKPGYAVISVGVDNKFGHPHQTVLWRLEKKVGASVFRTDKNGKVVFSPVNGRLEVSIEK